MEIEFFGANCFKLKTKNANIIIDDNLENLGAKCATKSEDVLLVTSQTAASPLALKTARLVLDGPGEFEVGDVSIQAVASRGHMDDDGTRSATVYQCMYDGRSVTVLGHIHPDTSEDLMELIGGTDILIIPVGGHGFTLDPIGAITIVKSVEPDVVIPSHFEDKDLQYPIPMSSLDDFLKNSGMVISEEVDSFKISNKTDTELTTQSRLVVLRKKSV